VKVIVELGWLARAGKIVVEGTKFRVRREDGGYRVEGSNPAEHGHVKWDRFRDHAVIASGGWDLDLQFHPGATDFVWDHRTYRLGDMIFGSVVLHEAARPVIRGHVTTSGVRLQTEGPDFDPIIREIALVLALHSEALDNLRIIGGGGSGPGG
jgi:hypothetical protein